MAYREHVFSRKLNAIDDFKHNKQKCNCIIDEGGLELNHCIRYCVHSVLQGDILVNDIEKERVKRHKKCLRKFANKKTLDRERRKLIEEGGFLGSIIPTLIGLVRKLFDGQ